jgi:ribonuclease Z
VRSTAVLAVLVGIGACASPGGTDEAAEPGADATSSATQSPPEVGEGDMLVTLLGTGSPVLSTDRMGNSTLVQAGGLDLVFDTGRGTAVRLCQAGVGPGGVDATFITHFHSDHINGLADIWMTGYVPAIGARAGAFQLYGPTGIANLGSGLTQAYERDAVVRIADGEVKPETIGIQTHEFAQDGVIFEQDGVKVTMLHRRPGPRRSDRPGRGLPSRLQRQLGADQRRHPGRPTPSSSTAPASTSSSTRSPTSPTRR